jgi:hypothetical protein
MLIIIVMLICMSFRLSKVSHLVKGKEEILLLHAFLQKESGSIVLGKTGTWCYYLFSHLCIL